MRWPLPALLTWAAAWAVFAGMRGVGVDFAWAGFAAALLGVAAAALRTFGSTPWRSALLGLGFPVSLLASGTAGAVPAWAWLLALAALLVLYPLRSWRDAPLFPTPRGALGGLAAVAPLPNGARIVDAGCGLGAGLIELRALYPNARLEGLEWSWPLRWACALRCRFAQVRRADIWAADWSGYDMVYLFQRPESMHRAAQKASRELAAGAWLVSLEFEIPTCTPQAVLQCDDGRSVLAYQAPLRL